MYHVPYIPAITEGVVMKYSKQEQEAEETSKSDDTVEKPCTIT